MGTKNSKLSPTDLKDLAKQTEFSEYEIQTWFKSFKKDCPSGKLALQEFKELYRNFFPNGDASEFAKHAFRTFDSNNDGVIDFHEFMCALSVTTRGNFDQKLTWAYNMYDQDNDGNITKKEMLNIMNAIHKMAGPKVMEQVINDGLSPQERVNKIFKRMDRDGDNKISLAEFKRAARQDPNLVMLFQLNSSNSDKKS